MSRGVHGEPPGFDDEPDLFGDYEGEHLDPEGPSAADLQRFGDTTRLCPSCGSEVYDDAVLCDVCGFEFDDATGKPAPWVLIVVVVALLAMLALFLF